MARRAKKPQPKRRRAKKSTPAPSSTPRSRAREFLERWQSKALGLRDAAAGRLETARKGSGGLIGAVVLLCLQFVFIVTLPFLVLVRGAMWLYEGLGLPTWLAIAGGALGTLGIVTAYGVVLSRRFTGKARLSLIAKWVAAPLVLGFCGYALLSVSRLNTKDDAVRSVYTAAHPLLRIAVTTLILLDPYAVITDVARVPDDYRRMGLATNRRSLHYRQDDGWVHAVDLRVRGWFKGWLVEGYFRSMGFNTLRHIGTADHLHVWLPVTYN